MGFDLGVHEQVLWNSAHGRIAASSPSVGTQSYFGIDIIVTELLLTPLYALFPGAHALLLAQTAALALGALPIYRMARERLGSSLAGLALAACFLLYAPVEWMNLYEFQIRAFATTFLLFAVEALWKRRAAPFLAWSLLALGCRSDVGLVVAGNRLLATYRNGATVFQNAILNSASKPTRFLNSQSQFSILPLALGLAWVALCTLVLIPAFRDDGRFLYGGVLLGEVSARCGAVPGAGLLNLPCLVRVRVFSGRRAGGAATVVPGTDADASRLPAAAGAARAHPRAADRRDQPAVEHAQYSRQHALPLPGAGDPIRACGNNRGAGAAVALAPAGAGGRAGRGGCAVAGVQRKLRRAAAPGGATRSSRCSARGPTGDASRSPSRSSHASPPAPCWRPRAGSARM